MPNYSTKRTIIGQIKKGANLYNSITRIVQENGIRMGRVTGMGAVQRAALAYYNQKTMTYQNIELNEALEIVSLYRNVSLKDGKPFAHVHVVLSDERGNGKGGHLLPDSTPVFACEITIEEFEGPALVRGFEETSGLTLWSEDKTL